MSPEFYIRIDARHLEKCKAAHIHLGRETCHCEVCDRETQAIDEADCTCDTCDCEGCWCHDVERKP